MKIERENHGVRVIETNRKGRDIECRGGWGKNGVGVIRFIIKRLGAQGFS